ncbi:MAG: serine hydrolase [Lacibacter sp.]
MKKILHRYVRVTFLLFIQTLLILNIAAQGFSPQVQSRLQHIIDSFQNNPVNPFVGGMSVTINVDGLAIWQGATGYAARNIDADNNLVPGGSSFTNDKLSRIYSVTKTFCAALVLELAQEGVLNLETPVNAILPMNLINPELNGSVTIRQLLAHESGYSDFESEYMLQVSVAYMPSHQWTAFEAASFTHQINPPGTVRQYSNTNYVLLGAIVEAVTGKPVEQHFRERFFDKLGLTSMYFAEREQPGSHGELVDPHDNISMFNPIFSMTGQPTFPDAYTNIRRFPMTAVASLAFSGGAIVSNSADMAKWGNALFGGRATSASTLKTMLNSISSTPDEDDDYLGYGLWTNNKISQTDFFVGHRGGALGYLALMMYQPDRKMTIALVTNYHGCDVYQIEKKLYEALPKFITGNENRKEYKILLCWKGKEMSVAREAAPEFIRKGAYLGPCECCNTFKLADEITAENALTISPNPVKSHATITVNAGIGGFVSLQLFDFSGKMVTQLYSGIMNKGDIRQFNFEAGNLPRGTYICRMQTEKGFTQQKIVLH